MENFQLSELINLIGGGTPRRSESDYWNGDIPWLSVKDFNNDSRFVDTSEESITQLGFEKSSTKLLNPGMIIISARGTVGELAQLKTQMAFNQSCYGIDANSEYLENDYLYYLLKIKIRELKSIAHGSVFETITRKTFENIFVDLPSKIEQKKISSILGALDKKIELNQKMNETLEEIAKTLFKSWFIDFDPVRAKAEGRPTGLSKEISELFPDSFEDSELGEMPRGWRIKSLSKITSFKNGFAFKSKDWTESGKPVVKIRNVKPLILDIEGCSFISDDLKKYDEYLLSKGDILIGMTGYVGETCLVPKLKKMPYQNQRVGKLIPTKDFFREFLFSFTRQSSFKRKVEEIAQGSAQQNVSGRDILELDFVFGNEEILKMFSDSTSDIFKKILSNFEENIILTELRDTLLPKLVSGEVKISNTE